MAPRRAVVIEDAVAGVEAGHRGGFGVVVGIDRAGHRAELEAAGADVVLEDVSEVDLGLVIADPWLTSVIEGQETEDEHMVNVPDWLPLDLCVEGGTWWSDGGLQLRSERRTLNLKRALLTREALLEDDAGRQLKVVQRRLVSMAEPHLAALETTLTAVGWDGQVSIRSDCDTAVTNSNVAVEALLSNRHLAGAVVSGAEDGTGAATQVVLVQTSQSRIGIALAIRTEVPASLHPGLPRAGRTVLDVLKRSAGGFELLRENHEAAWVRLLRPSSSSSTPPRRRS